RRWPWGPLLRADRDPVAGPPGPEPDPRHHSRRREPASAGHDHRPLSRAHDPRRREEGREDPRRRRLDCPRTRQPLGRASKRGKGRRVGYTYLHSAIDGFSRLAYTEPLEDETAATTIGFLHRAFAFFAAHGITRITRLISDNGPNYRSNAFARSIRGKVSRHQRTRPYTPRHNGKVERFQRITVDEFLYAEVFESEQERRNRHGVWLHHYNYHRPHTACGDQPPASRLHASVDNVMTNYS